MPTFKVLITHEQTLRDSRLYEIEAESEEQAGEIAESAWDAYNDGETDDVLVIAGKRYMPPDAEEVVDGDSSIKVLTPEFAESMGMFLRSVETPHG